MIARRRRQLLADDAHAAGDTGANQHRHVIEPLPGFAQKIDESVRVRDTRPQRRRNIEIEECERRPVDGTENRFFSRQAHSVIRLPL